MLILLPLLCFSALFYLLSRQTDWRRAFLASTLVWGSILAFATEGLSALHALTGWSVALLWGIATVVSIATLIRLGVPRSFSPRIASMDVTKSEWMMLIGMALIGAVTLIIAILAPPNNWDSMSYHMARTMHWIQNQSTAFYPTHIDFQLHLAPWAEYAITHFYLLAGNDRPVNLIQWFSLVGCAVGVSLIAADLGAERTPQIFAALVSMTIPIGILEASSTQNDYVLAFWCVALAHYTLDAAASRFSASNVLGYGASIALAVFTKGTSYFFAFPFVIAYVVMGLRALGWRFSIRAAAIVALFAAINTPHLVRTATVFGSPLGPTDIHTVSGIGPATLASNMLRHTLMNIYLPTETGPLAQAMNTAVSTIHVWLGLSTGDIRTSFMRHPFAMPYYFNRFGLNPYAFHEDRAGSPFHVVSYVLTVLIAQIWLIRRRHRQLVLYIGLVATGFVLFSLLVKWQMFATRYQLPLMVLMAPGTAMVFSTLQRRKVEVALAIMLLAQAVPFLVANYSRPAIPPFVRVLEHQRSIYSPRAAQYFTNRPTDQADYEGAVEWIVESGCTQIGLFMIGSNSGWEYPVWALLLDHYNFGEFRLEHIGVDNQTRDIAEQPFYRDFKPCALILLDQPISEQALMLVGDYYVPSYTSRTIQVFTRVP